MKLLTADIVWLVQREVTLADGSVQTVLVPQVYVRVKEGDLRGDGTLMAGNEVRLDVAGDINNSATIAGRSVNALVAENINNLGGRILGDTVTVAAGNDINNLSGTIAGNNIALQAGRDINIATRTVDSVGATGTRTGADRVAVVRGEQIAAAAGRDLVIAGAQINASGDIVLLADRKATIETVRTNSTLDLATRGHIREQEAGHVGSLIEAGGDLTVASGIAQDGDLTVRGSALRAGGELSAVGTNVTIESAVASRTVDIFTQLKNGTRSIDEHTEAAAGGSLSAGSDLTILARGSRDPNGLTQSGTGDITLKGAQLSSDSGAITLAAGNDVHLVQQQLAYSLRDESTYKGGTAFSSKSSNTLTDIASTQSIGSTISGNSIRIGADHDITAKAATVVATRDVTLSAGNDITITTAEDTSRHHHVHQEKTSGLFSNGGASITLGSQQLDRNSDSQSLTHTGSQVASLEGDIRIDAGKKYRQTGSDVLALAGDIDIAARQVDINAAIGTHASRQQEKTRQGGLSLSFSNAVISAAQTVTQMAESSGNTEDSRMQALAAATAAMSVSNAAAEVAKDPQNLGGSKITLSLGSSKSESNSEQQATVATGSKVAAGGDVTIAATGAGQDSNLTVIGSDIIAGHDATLTADNQIKLLAAQNTLTERSDNQSSSASIGIGFASGGTQNGFTVEVAASSARGNADGSDITHTNSHISAGNTAALASGGDTTLQGAVVSGKQVQADIGGNLDIESLQDSSQFDSKQSNSGFSASICVPPFCYGSSSASVNTGKAKIDGDYLSVVEQSGIQAGDGGFDVKVQGNTDLQGAVIASTDKAADEGRNVLITKTLTATDIYNHTEYSGSSVNVAMSYSNETKKDQNGNAKTDADGNPVKVGYNGANASVPGVVSASGNAQSVTRSGVSEGSITITDAAAQASVTGQSVEETIISLNRDTSNTENSLAPIFNEQEIQAGFQIVGTFSQELGTFLQNRAEEADEKTEAARAKEERAVNDNTLTDTQRSKLLNEASQLRGEAKDITDNWGPGGSYRQIATALSAAVSGNAGGSAAHMVQAGVVNYLQQQGAGYIGELVGQGELQEGSPEHAALHAIVACAGAAASNQNCSSGAMGAAASSFLTNLFTSSPAESGETKEAKRNIVASLVAGIAATSGADITAAVNAATAAADNNWLQPKEIEIRKLAQRKCELTGDRQACGTVRVLNSLDAKREAANEGTLYKGVTTGITELVMSPVKAPTELLNSVIEQGAIETAVNVVKGVVGLPGNLYDGITSDDPEVQGKALVDALALGYGVTQVAKLVRRGAGGAKEVLQQGENSFSRLGDVTTSPWLNDSRVGVRVAIEEFRDGGSYLVPRSTYENWISGKDAVGRADGQFMTSKSAMDRLLQEANGDMNVVKQKLGIPQNQWNEPLVRVDVMNPLLHNARLPSGLNSGANSQFQWGGYTSGGMPELITNPIPKTDIRATLITGRK